MVYTFSGLEEKQKLRQQECTQLVDLFLFLPIYFFLNWKCIFDKLKGIQANQFVPCRQFTFLEGKNKTKTKKAMTEQQQQVIWIKYKTLICLVIFFKW